MNNLLKTASKSRSLAQKKPLFSAVESQRALHTPLGSSKARDDSFQVKCHLSSLPSINHSRVQRHSSCTHRRVFWRPLRLNLSHKSYKVLMSSARISLWPQICFVVCWLTDLFFCAGSNPHWWLHCHWSPVRRHRCRRRWCWSQSKS